jgi:hypothetical protein
MKKYILVFLALISFNVLADSVTIGPGFSKQSNGTRGQDFSIKYIHSIDSNFDIDALVNNMQNTSTHLIQTQYETGIRYKFLFNDNFVPYIRTSLGTIATSGMTSLNYVGLESGVIARPFSNDLYVRGDYTEATALNYDSFNMHLTRAWLGYDLTEKDSVSIRKDWMNGSINFNQINLFYTRKF